MSKDWYSDLAQSLKNELEESKDTNGQDFLIDYFTDTMLFDGDEVEDYVNGVITEFEKYLTEKHSDWFEKGEDFDWGKKQPDEKKSTPKPIAPENIGVIEEKITNKNLDQYIRLLNDIEKENSLKNEAENTVEKIAWYYDQSSNDNSVKGEWWYRAGEICKSVEWFEKSATYYDMASNHTQSILSCNKAIELGKETKIQDSQLLKLVTFKKKRIEYSGDSEEYSKIFIEENRIKKRTSVGLKKLWMNIYWFLSNYGESPFRVVLNAGGVIIIFTLCYWIFGISTSELVHGETVDTCKSRGFFTSLYFSFVTFTTLGYGDYSPCLGVGRALSSLLAVLGLFITSFAIATVVRKYSR